MGSNRDTPVPPSQARPIPRSVQTRTTQPLPVRSFKEDTGDEYIEEDVGEESPPPEPRVPRSTSDVPSSI